MADVELRSARLVGGTLATDVLHRLREDIISCILKPGDRLRFEQLKEIYGVSFSTLREALSCLASERLVVSIGQRGFAVAPISSEDLLDVTDARVLVERECLRRAMEQGDAKWKAHIMSSFHRLDRADQALGDRHGITGEWDVLHSEFHEALVAASHSPTLSEVRHMLFERARRYRRLSAIVRSAPRAKRAEHREIMEVVLGGDIPLAQDMIEGHIREVSQNVIANGLGLWNEGHDAAAVAAE